MWVEVAVYWFKLKVRRWRSGEWWCWRHHNDRFSQWSSQHRWDLRWRQVWRRGGEVRLCIARKRASRTEWLVGIPLGWLCQTIFAFFFIVFSYILVFNLYAGSVSLDFDLNLVWWFTRHLHLFSIRTPMFLLWSLCYECYYFHFSSGFERICTVHRWFVILQKGELSLGGGCAQGNGWKEWGWGYCAIEIRVDWVGGSWWGVVSWVVMPMVVHRLYG